MPSYRGYDYTRFARTVDHALLRPELTVDDVTQG